MSSNRIEASDVKPILLTAGPRRPLCGCSRSTKIMWLAVSIILFATAASVPVILRNFRKTNANNSSMADNATEELLIEWTEMPVANSQAPTTQTSTTTTTATTSRSNRPLKWSQNAASVAGGNGGGSELNQLNGPSSVHVYDDKQVILVTDRENHRVMEWKFGAKEGKVLAGGNGPGGRTDQLQKPADAILNKKRDSVIVCDHQNMRIVVWSREKSEPPRSLGSPVVCWGLALDSNGDLYVAYWGQNEVKRWKDGEWSEVRVAGGYGVGMGPKQLNAPTYIFVDKEDSLYIADNNNRRVMKWTKDATEGIQVAPMSITGGVSAGAVSVNGMTVDRLGRVYTTSRSDHYVMRWLASMFASEVVVGRDQHGSAADRLSFPAGLCFDEHDNLYVVDMRGNRVQKFSVDPN